MKQKKMVMNTKGLLSPTLHQCLASVETKRKQVNKSHYHKTQNVFKAQACDQTKKLNTAAW